MVLENHLREKGAKALRAQGQAIPATDPTDPDEYDRQLREEHGPPPPYAGSSARQGTHEQAQGQTQTQPSQSRVHDARQTQSAQTQAPAPSGGGWFGGFGRKKKQPDIERGNDVQMTERPGPPMPPRPNEAAPTAQGASR